MFQYGSQSIQIYNHKSLKKVIFESKNMSSIWRLVDFDSLGSTAVQEGDDSVISISDEEEQAKHQYDTSASDGEQK